MTAFLPWAIPLVAAAIVLLCLPLLGRRADGAPPARWLATGLGLGTPVLCAVLYPLWSNYSWQAAAQRELAATHAGVPALRAAVAAHPGDVQALDRLGSAYAALERWPEARATFAAAVQASGGRDAPALAGLGQVLVLTGDGSVGPAALRLFEQALAIDATSPQALFYSGLAYLQAGRTADARARFLAMMALGPPENVKSALARQVAQLDAQLADEAAAAASAIHLKVLLAPALTARVPAGASLFLFVPAPQGGPPLAARRLAATFPQETTLSAANAMIPGHAFKAGDRVRVGARLSKSGSPTGSAGDLQGTIELKAGDGALHELVIDSVAPGS